MFTGLVERIGTIEKRGGGKLIIQPSTPWQDLVHGESIAVNGCCLTLEKVHSSGAVEFHTLEESLRCTNLGVLTPGTPVNLERAMQLGGRMGGHIVQGHVDTVAKVKEFRRLPDGDMKLLVELPPQDAVLVVEKGSIAIDGISLTVVEAAADYFGVRLIPVTLAETALQRCKPGALVNLEYDIIGRYILRKFTCEPLEKSSGITMEMLTSAGFM